MADETQAANSQADETQNGADSQAEGADETISLEEAKKLRSEANNLRKRLKAAEGEVEGFKTSQLSETEKLNKRIEETTKANEAANSRLQNLVLERALDEIGKPLGMRSAKTTAKFVEREGLQFDLDKLGVSGLDSELKRLKAEYPDLFVDGGNDGGKGNESRVGKSQDMNAIIRGNLKR